MEERPLPPNVVEALSQGIYKRSSDPKHPDNVADPDWQAGFFTGCALQALEQSGLEPHRELADEEHPTTVEWRRRGCPKRTDSERGKKFTSWKQGYWAGRFSKLLVKVTDEKEETNREGRRHET